MTGLARRLLGKKTCLCTTAKRDSFYDDPAVSSTKNTKRQSADQYGFVRTEKPRRLMRQTSMDESDVDDDAGILGKLRRASSQFPANIPMLVVVSFTPDAKGLQKNQIEIQRGYPVNAQYILNEWLFIKTADNEEGYVPYLCCRPMFRRQLAKSTVNNIENSYRPYDFELNKSRQIKLTPTNLSTLTPPTTKKFSLTTNHTSNSYLSSKSTSSKKRHDVTSSSCGGDSGVSDCESSSHIPRTFEVLSKRMGRSSNTRALRSSSSTSKKSSLIVQDLPSKRTIQASHLKSQLAISSNSAFTQITKKKQSHESNQCHPGQEIPLSSSSIKSNSRRLYESCDDTANLSFPSSKYPSDNHTMISSANIRRTPYARRSLSNHMQSVLSKPLQAKLTSSSDSFQIIKEQQLRNIVLAEPSIPPTVIVSKSKMERHFSDLSLNQIENDSLSPSTPLLLVHGRPSLSCSSSSSAASSLTDGSNTPFIHIQMNNYRTGQIPVVYASSNTNNSNSQPTKSASFIHNVSITV